MAEFKEGDGLQRELGISRRELMRRGAIVGGTLLWAAPLVQTLGPAARAQVQRPSLCGCCYCFDATNPNNDICNVDGFVGERSSAEGCAAFCAAELLLAFGTAPANVRSQHCQGKVGDCSCELSPSNEPTGCECSP